MSKAEAPALDPGSRLEQADRARVRARVFLELNGFRWEASDDSLIALTLDAKMHHRTHSRAFAKAP